MLKYEGDDFESMFNLTFEITRQRFDQTVTVELIENGSKIPGTVCVSSKIDNFFKTDSVSSVTKDNCKQYVNAYIDYIFNKSVEIPFNAFSQGFHYVCGSKVLVSESMNQMRRILNEIYSSRSFSMPQNLWQWLSAIRTTILMN